MTVSLVKRDEDDEDDGPIPVLERRLRRLSSNSSIGEGGLASPPPSHRKPTLRSQSSKPASAVLEGFRTPSPHAPTHSLKFPVPDSPNNPFLDKPTEAENDEDDDDDEDGPIQDEEWEPATITYVQ